MKKIRGKLKLLSMRHYWWVPVLAGLIVAIYFLNIRTDYFKQIKGSSIKPTYSSSNDESKSGPEKALIDSYSSNNDTQSKANNLKSLAFQYIYSGDIDPAISTLEKAKKELPSKNLDFEFYELLANCYQKKNMKTQANLNFDKAISTVKSSNLPDKATILARLQEEKQ